MMRDLIRQILQGYKSLKLEGQGEGYVLFSGEEPDTRQAVSIKILPRLLGEDPQIAARFDGLARTIRQLNHPNVASIHKVGQEAGLPYVVTRAIEKGHALAVKLDQPWAVDTAADIVMQVGQALDHAYRKGVIHGALSPENIVVEDDGRVMVTDFGLSELMDLVGARAKEAGSPYLAPERVAGQAADARADVYSMAAILYSMLTKRTPQVVKGKVLPPSRFNPDVPETMDQVLVKALAPDPSDRYPDATSFLAALGAVTLAPAKEKSLPPADRGRCPRCGTEKQTGRFCRKCGLRLEPPAPKASPQPPLKKSVLDEPIQVTTVEVGHVDVGKGVELTETKIAQPMPVASGDLAFEFPEPVEMPQLDMQSLWPSLGDEVAIAMPEPPAMPVIDWAEVAPPMPEVPTIESVRTEEESD
jgi:serine/threonine protein kinase